MKIWTVAAALTNSYCATSMSARSSSATEAARCVSLITRVIPSLQLTTMHATPQYTDTAALGNIFLRNSTSRVPCCMMLNMYSVTAPGFPETSKRSLPCASRSEPAKDPDDRSLMVSREEHSEPRFACSLGQNGFGNVVCYMECLRRSHVCTHSQTNRQVKHSTSVSCNVRAYPLWNQARASSLWNESHHDALPPHFTLRHPPLMMVTHAK